MEKPIFMDRFFLRLYNFIVNNAVNLAFYTSLLCFAFAFWIRYQLIFLQFPDIGGIEQNVIYSIQRILAGLKLYENPAVPPYSITQYSPLYYYLTAFVGKIFNVNPDIPFEVFTLSRSVSLFLNVLLLGVCFLILKSIYKVESKIAVVPCVFIFLYLERNIYSRPDSLYSLFFLITIYLFILFLKESADPRRLIFLILSSVSSVLTIYSKQSGIYLPLILIFFMIFYLKNYKEIITAVFSMTIAFFILLFVTSGDDVNIFFQNVYKGVDNGIDLMFFYKAIVRPYFRNVLIWNILGFATALYYLKNNSELSLKFLSISIIATYLFALVTGLKQGATPSYFTEHINLLFITLTIFLFAKPRYFNVDFIRMVFLLTVVFFLPYVTQDHYQRYEFFYTNYSPKAFEKSEKVYQYLSDDMKLNSAELVFIMENNYSERQFLDNFLYKNNIMPQKKILSFDKNNMPLNSSFDYSHLTENLNSGLIKYLIVNRDRGINKYMGVEFTNFKHIKEIEDFSIYVYSPENL